MPLRHRSDTVSGIAQGRQCRSFVPVRCGYKNHHYRMGLSLGLTGRFRTAAAISVLASSAAGLSFGERIWGWCQPEGAWYGRTGCTLWLAKSHFCTRLNFFLRTEERAPSRFGLACVVSCARFSSGFQRAQFALISAVRIGISPLARELPTDSRKGFSSFDLF